MPVAALISVLRWAPQPEAAVSISPPRQQSGLSARQQAALVGDQDAAHVLHPRLPCLPCLPPVCLLAAAAAWSLEAEQTHPQLLQRALSGPLAARHGLQSAHEPRRVSVSPAWSRAELPA